MGIKEFPKCCKCGKLIADNWLHVQLHALYETNNELPLDSLYCSKCFKETQQ